MSTALPLQLRVLTSIRDVPEHAWDALVPKEAVPFLRWSWIDALESSGTIAPDRGWHPRHFTLWRGNTLVAAAPAYQKDNSHGEFVFDWSWASAGERLGLKYYPKLVLGLALTPVTGPRLLVAPGEDADARRLELCVAAVECARSEGLSSVHALFPTAEELKVFEQAGYAPRLGVQYHWQNRGYRTYEDFLSRFVSKRRTQLKRERRAATEQGLELRTLKGAALDGVDPKDAYRLYLSTVDKNVWGRRHLSLSFFERVLKAMRPWVEVVEVRRRGALVAGTFNLSNDRVLYGRYWGALEDVPFLHFHACLYHPIEECILAGRERFEPGAGGEHKLVRGFEPALTYSAHWIADPALDRAVRRFLQSERAAITEGLPQWRRETGFKEEQDG